PVISFLHRNPRSLPLAKSEESDDGRARLERFREKVRTGRMVDFWETPHELAWKVTTSLPNLIATYPAQGWVKGHHAAESESQVAQLRSRIAELERQLSEAMASQSPTPSLSQEASLILCAAASNTGKIMAEDTSEGYRLLTGTFYREKEHGDPRLSAR